ncbi:iron dicitrate transport regulator FecR [Caenimonas sedimenti]|uniref:Iron dicitrate transport regulator FecR n=2 Tax=Caenimonas sedimenti TaxID=2596921 RepID=A0A562ZK36_9BURK|nr:iron dicitrate transport regulator FecR [Caenimonas sedimenti]
MLQGRTEEEVFWFRRRSFLQGAAAFVAMGGFGAALAQQRSNIVELKGDAQLNGQPLRAASVIQTGDRIETGPGSNLVFVVGNASFLVRQNSRITVERGETLNTVSVLRMVTGAVASVWGRGTSRQIITPTLTAGIRGTGVYTEVFPEQDSRSYFCNCYGVVDVSAGRERDLSRAEYHQSYWGEAQPKDGKLLTAAPPINHTDEELEMLAQLVDQRTAWQITGRKGQKASDAGGGSGYGAAKPAAGGAPAAGAAPASSGGGYGASPTGAYR